MIKLNNKKEVPFNFQLVCEIEENQFTFLPEERKYIFYSLDRCWRKVKWNRIPENSMR